MSYILITQLNISSRPNFTFQNRHHYGDYNEHFGAWHLPNKSFNHKKSCFDVVYTTNSYGAVDKERVFLGKNRTVVIGDSMVEGYGLNKKNRFSNLIEKKLKIPHLNFGTSGHFGTTQYRLLYENLASNFEHSKVIVFITASNDFEDDSYSFGKKIHSNRYRPYMIERDNEYDLIYTNKLKTRFSFFENSKNILNNFTHTYHLLRYLKSIITSEKIKSSNNEVIEEKNILRYSFYDVFKEDGFKLFEHNLLLINTLAKKNSADLIIVLLPSKTDVDIYIEKNKKIPKLVKKFEDFSKKNNIKFIDILTHQNFIKFKSEDLFFECDGHPNILANKSIAEILIGDVYEKN